MLLAVAHNLEIIASCSVMLPLLIASESCHTTTQPQSALEIGMTKIFPVVKRLLLILGFHELKCTELNCSVDSLQCRF